MVRTLSLTAATFALALGALAQEAAAPAHPLTPFYGTWVGTASGYDEARQPYTVTQTERVGLMLDGAIAVIEGRGYRDDGSLAFNAFAVVSCSEDAEACDMNSYLPDRTGSFKLVPTETGFIWTIPAGPEAEVKYVATLDGDVWTEIGHYQPASGDPMEIFRMEVTRTGDTDWPAGGAVLPPATE